MGRNGSRAAWTAGTAGTSGTVEAQDPFWTEFTQSRKCVVAANDIAKSAAENATLMSLDNLDADGSSFADDLAFSELQRLHTAESKAMIFARGILAGLRAALAQARVAGGSSSVVALAVQTEILKSVVEEKRAREERLAPLVGTRLVSLPNIGFIGRGYNILEGNPRDQEYGADRGYRLPIVDLPYSVPGHLAADARHILPDNVDAIEAQASSFTSVATFISSELEFKQQLDTAIQADASVGIGAGKLFSVRYSYSSSYQRSVEGLRSAKTSYVEIEAASTSYNASLLPGIQHRPTADFMAWFCLLPSVYDASNTLVFTQFIERYGTHVIRQAAFGGVGIQRYSMTETQSEAFWSEMTEAEHSQGSGASYKGAGTGQSIDAGFALGKEAEAMLSTMGVSRSEWYIGGSPAVGSFDEGSTDAAKEWSRTVDENPVPIWIALAYLPDFVASLQMAPDVCTDGLVADRIVALEKHFETEHGSSNDNCATHANDVLRFGDLVTMHRRLSMRSTVFEFFSGSPSGPPFRGSANQVQVATTPSVVMSRLGHHLSNLTLGTQCTSMTTLYCVFHGKQKASYMVACGARYYILGPFHHVLVEYDPRKAFKGWPKEDPYWGSDNRNDIIVAFKDYYYQGSVVVESGRHFLAVFRESETAREVWQAKLVIIYDWELDTCVPQVDSSRYPDAFARRSNTYWAGLKDDFTAITPGNGLPDHGFYFFVKERLWAYNYYVTEPVPPPIPVDLGLITASGGLLGKLASQYHKDYTSPTSSWYLRIRMVAFQPSYDANMAIISTTLTNRQFIYYRYDSNELLIAPNYNRDGVKISRYTMTDYLALSSNYVPSFLLAQIRGTVNRPWQQEDLQYVFRLQSSATQYNQVHRPVYSGDQIYLISYKDAILYNCSGLPTVAEKACYRDVPSPPPSDDTNYRPQYASFLIRHRDPNASNVPCIPLTSKESVLLQVLTPGADNREQFGIAPARLLMDRNVPSITYGSVSARLMQDFIVDSDESENFEQRALLTVTKVDPKMLAPNPRVAFPFIACDTVEIVAAVSGDYAKVSEVYVFDEMGNDITFLGTADQYTHGTEVTVPSYAIDRNPATTVNLLSIENLLSWWKLKFPYPVRISRISLLNIQDGWQNYLNYSQLVLYRAQLLLGSWALNGDLRQDIWVGNNYSFVSSIQITFRPAVYVGLKEVIVIAPDGSDVTSYGVASQSTTLLSGTEGFFAFNAIDGNLSTEAISDLMGSSYPNYCEWWKLSFLDPLPVDHVVIVNRNDWSERLNGAIFEAVGPIGEIILTKTLTAAYNQTVTVSSSSR